MASMMVSQYRVAEVRGGVGKGVDGVFLPLLFVELVDTEPKRLRGVRHSLQVCLLVRQSDGFFKVDDSVPPPVRYIHNITRSHNALPQKVPALLWMPQIRPTPVGRLSTNVSPKVSQNRMKNACSGHGWAYARLPVLARARPRIDIDRIPSLHPTACSVGNEGVKVTNDLLYVPA